MGLLRLTSSRMFALALLTPALGVLGVACEEEEAAPAAQPALHEPLNLDLADLTSDVDLSGTDLDLLDSDPLSIDPDRADPRDRPHIGDPRGPHALVHVDDCYALRGYLVDVALEEMVMDRYGWYWGWFMDDDMDGDAVTSQGTTGSDAPDDFTTTNVQEAGVDEADFLKTDGTYIYVAHQDELTIVDSWPAETAHVEGRLAMEGRPHDLFLYGDRALVFSYLYDDQTDVPLQYSGTRLTLVDLTDRSAPSVLREIDIDGYFASARMIDGEVYVVLNHYAYLPWELRGMAWDNTLGLPEASWEDTEEERETKSELARDILRPYVQSYVATMDLDELLPQYSDTDNLGAVENLHECADLYRPPETARLGVLTVAHLGMDDGEFGATGLIADGWTVYASQDNLYVAQSSWWWWWGWGSMNMDSTIHKFQLGHEAPIYRATGVVDGWLLNQFSMSEHNGYLRVASTLQDWWWGTGANEGGNIITVLGDNWGSLEEVGSVRDLAPGEQIRASRLMGDVGYIVTFPSNWGMDPLFTLDLSDPTNPTVLGELHIPGFSTYLHPMGDDHLLAVGRDGDDTGRVFGMAISVYDVSDLSSPQLSHKLSMGDEGWAWSESMWNHHAFTWRHGVLSIPARESIYDDVTQEWDYFSGLIVYDASPAGISERGRVDHVDLVDRSECLYGGSYCQDYYWYANMRRSIYMEDYLFSVSSYGIKVSDLNEPEAVSNEVLFWPR